MSGDVDGGRSDGDEVVSKSPGVSIFSLRFVVVEIPLQLIERIAVVVGASVGKNHLVKPYAISHAADASAVEFGCRGNLRDIDVEECVGRKSVGEDILAESAHDIEHRREISIEIVIAERKRYGRNVLDGALESNTAGAAVVTVGRSVIAVVDASEDEIRLARVEHSACHLYAVDRSSGASVDGNIFAKFGRVNLAKREVVHSESTRFSGAWPLWSADDDIA